MLPESCSSQAAKSVSGGLRSSPAGGRKKVNEMFTVVCDADRETRVVQNPDHIENYEVCIVVPLLLHATL